MSRDGRSDPSLSCARRGETPWCRWSGILTRRTATFMPSSCRTAPRCGRVYSIPASPRRTARSLWTPYSGHCEARVSGAKPRTRNFGLMQQPPPGLTGRAISVMFPICSIIQHGLDGAALPSVRGRPFAQPRQGRADVRARRGERVRAPALAADRRQTGLPPLRLPDLL
jgi:hypothetical protein